MPVVAALDVKADDDRFVGTPPPGVILVEVMVCVTVRGVSFDGETVVTMTVWKILVIGS